MATTTTIAIILLVIVSSSVVISCPSECSCSSTLVDCSRRQLTAVPQNISDVSTELLLNDNAITSIRRDAFAGLRHLKSIRLSDNGITFLEPGLFHEVGSLCELYLDDNGISVIGNETFVGLTSLKIVSLSYNRITTIAPTAFSEPRGLEDLYLDNNDIAYIPNGAFAVLSNLKILSLAQNEMTIIEPGLLGELRNLEQLFLNGNAIVTIAKETFSLLSNLRILSLSSNQISTIPADLFMGLQKLEDLYLDDNQISWLPNETFSTNVNLRIISLAGNNLTGIEPGLFRKQRSLEELFLNGNNLQSIANETFAKLNNLLRLHLVGNELRSLPEGVFPSTPSREMQIDWNENPWHCDCTIRWIQQFLQWIRSPASVTCHTPSAHSASLLTDIQPQHLACPPEIQVDELDVHLEATSGTWVELVCPASGDPSPQVSWLNADDMDEFGGGDQEEIASPLMVHSNGSLTIGRATRSDSGNYTCTATNPGGSDQLRYHLTIIDNGNNGKTVSHLVVPISIGLVVLLCTLVFIMFIVIKFCVNQRGQLGQDGNNDSSGARVYETVV